MLMIQEPWPNKLGVDILDERGIELGEVWMSRLDGLWGVRTFKENGEADKYMLLDPREFLFMNPFDAVTLCQAEGRMIE